MQGWYKTQAINPWLEGHINFDHAFVQPVAGWVEE